jgi:hypothetical protein
MNYFLLPSPPEGGPAYSPAARAINKIIDRTLLCFLGYIIRTTKNPSEHQEEEENELR